MSFPLSILFFFTLGFGIFFVLFMALKLRFFESTKYFFCFILCLYLIVFNSNPNIFKPFSSIHLAFEGTSYLIAFLGVFLRFYVRKMVYPVKSFSVKNLKHFTFPILVIIWGVYSKTIIIDEEILRILIMDNFPVIIIPTVSSIIFIIGFSYIIASLFFIIRFCSKQSSIFIKTNKKIILWIKIVIFIAFLFLIFELLLSLYQKKIFCTIIQFGQYLSVVILILYIVFSPKTVKKMRGCVYVIPEASNLDDSFLLPLAYKGTIYDYWHIIIEDYITIKMPHLKMDFNVNKMAADLSVSKQKVTLILKYIYQMDFVEFVNRHRIYYFLELSNDKTFSSMNVDDQIIEVGFYNKSDFYYNFRKYTNCVATTNLKPQSAISEKDIGPISA